MTASERSAEELLSVILGEPVYEKCTIGNDVVETYSKKAYKHQLDDCYTVLTSDCGKQHKHAVLGKLVGGKKHLMVFVENSKVTMEPTTSYTESRKEYEVEIDGKRISLKPSEKKEVMSRDGKVSYRIYRSPDSVLVLETPYTRVTYDAETIEIEHLSTQTRECGLCGEKTGDKKISVKSAQQCAAKTIEQAALTYRIQKSCSSLTVRQQQVRSQEQICKKEQQQQQRIAKIPVSRTLQGLLEKCKQTRHSIIRHGDRLCISQIPIVECGSGCSARSEIAKEVTFTCLPANRERVNKLYEEKVNRGEILPELRTMDKTFSSMMTVPVSCSHPGL